MDEIKKAFKPIKINPLEGMNFTYEIERRVREDEENFIFETIEPYCSNIAQQKLSKKDLDEAIQLWMAAKRIMHVEEESEEKQEIIHCKDCWHFHPEEGGWCGYHGGRLMNACESDYYCADAEAKTDE